LDQVIHRSLRLQQSGLRACPHIVARRIAGESELRSALHDLNRIGVDQILLVAGDLPKPVGVFTSTLEILDSGATVDAGIHTIGVAGDTLKAIARSAPRRCGKPSRTNRHSASAAAPRSTLSASSVSTPPPYMTGNASWPVTPFGCRYGSESPDPHR
jgi:hypothetical protein